MGMLYFEPEFKIIFVSEVDVVRTSSTQEDENFIGSLPEDEL